MEKKEKKSELEREIKRNKNGLLMLNRVLDKEEVEWLYKKYKTYTSRVMD